MCNQYAIVTQGWAMKNTFALSMEEQLLEARLEEGFNWEEAF
jgi:hypothetical protein